MKYEDWIKYEQLRQSQPPPLVLVKLPLEQQHLPAPEAEALSPKENQPVWTMVVQLFNSRRI